MQVDAFAKLTLSLHITGVRADGYHELDSLMVTVSEPRDLVTIEPGSTPSIAAAGPFAEGVPLDGTNLAQRAMDACGVTGRVHIYKGIPHGAGLGGGSADAAAVIRALGGDEAMAGALGADVLFCYRGGAARVRGIGDLIEPVEPPALRAVIATPPYPCYTSDVYRAWDALGGPRQSVNDLEPAAQHVEPRLVEFKATVEDAAGARAILAGSGSSYAVLFDEESAAERARARVAAAIDGWTWVGRTVATA